MDIYLFIVLFIIIFMLHNLEEVFAIERWFKMKYPLVQTKIPLFAQKEIKKFENFTSAQFAVVVFVFSIACSAFILMAVLTEKYYLFLGVSLLFALNIVTHPLQALYLRCYTPGLWTTLVLIIPYYCLFLYQIIQVDMFSIHEIFGSIIVMVLLIPIFILSHIIGEKSS